MSYLDDKVKFLTEHRDELLEALRNFVDDEPCCFDHHGYCQTHGVSQPCINEIAKKAIAKVEGKGRIT